MTVTAQDHIDDAEWRYFLDRDRRAWLWEVRRDSTVVQSGLCRLKWRAKRRARAAIRHHARGPRRAVE